ncbi:MAG: hypothetical protein PVG22_16980, partial [Chromatiales bacterium]
MTGQAQAEPYRPDCQIDDELCAIWSQFRALHPYPTQRLTAHIISDDELALVISEPSPALRKTELKELITTVFSTDLLEYREFKWMIGMDGWVEDIVVRLKKAKVSHQDKPSDELFSDRLALLEIALFGTTQGSDIETLDLTRPATDPIRLPNLELSAAEISDWITSKKIVWNTLDSPPRRIGHWMDQSIVGTRQVLLSDDKTLVMLSFPSSDIEWARRTGSLPDQMQSTFRSFAVNADVIIGGAWTDRQLAILARARQVPEKDFPPLRFETFELLAAQNSPELHQSYERTHLFAGKLTSGRYAFRDWAPIYLSPALIDTQFGALLNITDQMLKSWSQAGETEYLYFNYPQKPDRFPFDGRPISDLVYEKTGSQQVLFNWNTAGMGTVITGDPSILVTKRTGALPVTYGSELVEGGEMKTGHLQEFENEAYGYFANLED